jgi:PncC family amidohydrolase
MISSLARQIGAALAGAGQEISVAESCTGGGVAAAITAVEGASAWFKLGIVTYSNEAKQGLLGVPAVVFSRAGAVSKDCAVAMAVGLARKTGADWCLSVTGIAGPAGGSAEKPVGLVYFGLAGPDGVRSLEKSFGDPGREQIRALAVEAGLQLVADSLAGRVKPDSA